MEPGEYARLIARSWWAVLVIVLVGLIGAVGVTALQRPVYQATAKAYVTTTSAASAMDLSAATTFAQQIVKSYADVATTGYVLGPVISELRLPTTTDQLAKRVTASSGQNSVVLDIAVTDPSPTRAAAIANAVTQRLSTVVVHRLSPSGPGKTPGVSITQVETATPPLRPSSPVVSLNLAIGALLGLAAGLGVVTAWGAIDTRLRSVAAIRAATAVPVVGAIPQDRGERRHPLIPPESGGPRAEAFRAVATNLQFFEVDHRMRSALITSAASGEGKSSTAANLALAVAESGERVLLVDADLRRAGATAILGMEQAEGLTEVLLERATLESVIRPAKADGLLVLPAGTLPPNPSQLLRSERMVDLVNRLEQQFDLVVFDAPPLLAAADAAILARRTGGVLIVCALRHTRLPQLRAAIETLEQARVPLTGLIATMVRPERGVSAYGYRPRREPRRSRDAAGAAATPRPQRT